MRVFQAGDIVRYDGYSMLSKKNSEQQTDYVNLMT